ncbi:thioredoxin-related transmembrane protein 2 homolog isoform X2 [Amborella trichopoda]|uniref:thioredoxin-related transmembrane protein 2 homolog isoform X2 n=1 Tax=Amborella trichopoda TaxID=13333 RepID=UPI0005D3A5C8|nr:thioredoxin-related transmembrane protein 2 homolog isoform X2 [Amborella trichopoda]|eukprot:XP_011626727.1 thioredoxin-related transmembrane protein 2 homolog isoform X2 [Amborella trichopoda]
MAKSNPLQWLNVMLSEPFYLFHSFLFFSYLVVRQWATEFLSPQLSSHLLHREIQAILALFTLATVKLIKAETWEAFIADTFLYAKGFLIMVALVLDYHLAYWYLLGLSVVSILTRQPAFSGLGNSTRLTPLQLEVLLTEGNTSRFWLVEFRTLWSSKCIRTSRILADLSITYSNNSLSFGMVDLGLFPNAAEKFGISLVTHGQLPTYILFDKAIEIARYPEVDFESKASASTITKGLLARHFELDRRLIEYVSGN